MQPKPTPFPYINEVLENLRSQLQTVLGEKLVGLYLYGSLVTGDFDHDTSDIDLLAATATDLDDDEFNALDRMQNEFIRTHPVWEHRLEIAYLSLNALQTFKTQLSKIAVISPGEPFHFKNEGLDYLLNWYVVREKGIALFGPPPTRIIAPISKDEFLDNIRNYLGWWRDLIKQEHGRGSQAYAILTMCRALYSHRNGDQVSKLQAALWAAEELPQWSALIKNALVWRKTWREPDVDPAETIAETRRFVNHVIDQLLV